MSVVNWLKGTLLNITDSVMAGTPRSRPPREQLRATRIVAHRGAHKEHLENTLPAFRKAIEAGAWGVEFDVRWTKCGQPVVHHDPHCYRVFKDPSYISELRFTELRKRIPEIPTLEEVIEAVGGRAHLMIEIKGRASQIKDSHWQALKEALSKLDPVHDYHLMSMDYDILNSTPVAVNPAWLPIAELNVSSLSKLALERELGGLTGQYLVVNGQVMKRHKVKGQGVGTGFVNSASVLYREVSRGVDWVFSDNAEALTEIIRKET